MKFNLRYKLRAAGAGVAVALTVGACAGLAQTADRPDVKVGDRWVFKVSSRMGPGAVEVSDRVWIVTSVAATGIKGTENGKPLMLTPDLNVLESPRSKDSDPRRLSFPLHLGKQWSYTDNYVLKRQGVEGRISVNAKVVGYEKVRVPAGEFDAFKLERKGNWQLTSGETGESTETYWYAPAARTVVKSEYRAPHVPDTTTELAEFKLQP